LSWSIKQANAGDVRARVIVCGANNPVTARARDILAAKEVTYFPDFVSNSGGVLGSIIETLCAERAKSTAILRRQFEPKVQELLARAKRNGQSLEATATDMARANRHEMEQRAARRKNRRFRLAETAFRYGLLPRALVKVFGARYVRKTMA
jgi:glutamate dehydrogenase/leucine dehydrogenase